MGLTLATSPDVFWIRSEVGEEEYEEEEEEEVRKSNSIAQLEGGKRHSLTFGLLAMRSRCARNITRRPGGRDGRVYDIMLPILAVILVAAPHVSCWFERRRSGALLVELLQALQRLVQHGLRGALVCHDRLQKRGPERSLKANVYREQRESCFRACVLDVLPLIIMTPFHFLLASARSAREYPLALHRNAGAQPSEVL